MVNAQANASTSARTFLRFAGKSQKDFKHLKMPENRRCMQQFRKNKTAANIHKLDICGGICTEKSTEKILILLHSLKPPIGTIPNSV